MKRLFWLLPWALVPWQAQAADLANGERKTLDVVGSFPGCYQMLPAPDSFAGDEIKARTNLSAPHTVHCLGSDIIISMLGDRDTYKPSVLIPSVKRLRRSPFLRKEVWRMLRDYNRPDFHPDDHETDELLAEWREELFGSEGRLNHMMAGAA